jgi:aminoglycoside phosphotransferase (APT) family kinase protein
MPLSPAIRLGPYEIIAPLGAGGMGDVYRARDTRLEREVAIKALPAPFAADPERLARFRREAQTLASLNHPNIAAIYGLEEVSGTPYLVLELVEGETLADHLARGPLPAVEALRLCIHVAAALEAAHGVESCTVTSSPAISWSRYAPPRRFWISAWRRATGRYRPAAPRPQLPRSPAIRPLP